MKILQLNTWGGKLGRNITELLKRENADVVCMQEVIDIPGGESYFFEDLQELKKGAGYSYIHSSPTKEFNLMNRRATWGDAILSRLKFTGSEIIRTYLEKIEDFDFLTDRDYNAGRALQRVSVKTANGLLHVLNHHGHHLRGHKNGDEETMRQCGMIVDYIKKLDGPVVLCGDFNLVPSSPSIELINKILVNHVKERGIVTTRTPLTHKTEACDYIFTSPDIEVKNFQVLDDIVSDHKALTIEF